MTANERKDLENLVEHKILEFLGDPDAGADLKATFAAALRKRLNKKQKLMPLSELAEKYGAR